MRGCRASCRPGCSAANRRWCWRCHQCRLRLLTRLLPTEGEWRWNFGPAKISLTVRVLLAPCHAGVDTGFLTPMSTAYLIAAHPPVAAAPVPRHWLHGQVVASCPSSRVRAQVARPTGSAPGTRNAGAGLTSWPAIMSPRQATFSALAKGSLCAPPPLCASQTQT